MQRKLIQLSPSTAVVSLPAAWLRKNNLEKGAIVQITEQENTLTLAPQGVKKKESEITLDISKLYDRLMWIAIDAAYTAGYDSIILLTRDTEQSQYMAKVVRFLPGMIIHEDRKNRVHLRDIANTSQGDVDQIVNRIFNLTIALLEDALEAAVKKDWKTLEAIKNFDYNINSYVSYCLRQLNKYGYASFSKTGTMHSYIKILEMMGDKLCDLFLGVARERVAFKSESVVLGSLLELLRSAHRLHSKVAQDKMIVFEDDRKKLLGALSGIDDHVRLYLTEILELFFDLEQLEMQLNT